MTTYEPALAGTESAPEDREKWSLALDHLNEALRLLDEGDAPPELGAALDMAIHRLRTAIERADQSLP